MKTCNCNGCKNLQYQKFCDIIDGQFDSTPQVYLTQFDIIDVCIEKGVDYMEMYSPDFDVDAIDGIIDRIRPYNMEEDGA